LTDEDEKGLEDLIELKAETVRKKEKKSDQKKMRGKVFAAQNTGLQLIQREVSMENMIKKEEKEKELLEIKNLLKKLKREKKEEEMSEKSN